MRVPLQGGIQFAGVTFTLPQFIVPGSPRALIRSPLGTNSRNRRTQRLRQNDCNAFAFSVFHSNYEGLIKIDGVDVREYDVDHLRRSLGVVLQENFLFSGSISENIACGKPDAHFR